MAVLVDISKWDMSNVTDMSGMFENCTMNEDISAWDTSSCTNMERMFKNNSTFNSNIGSWNVSNVTKMNEMFEEAVEFNQSLNWDVANVVSMDRMFNNATSFAGDISRFNLNTAIKEKTPIQFINKTALSSLDLEEKSQYVPNSTFYYPLRNTSQDPVSPFWGERFAPAGGYEFIPNDGIYTKLPITRMDYMFSDNLTSNTYGTPPSINDSDIGLWDTSTVISMHSMFRNNRTFNQDIGNWDVSNCVCFNFMFFGATVFNQNLTKWDVTAHYRSNINARYLDGRDDWYAPYPNSFTKSEYTDVPTLLNRFDYGYVEGSGDGSRFGDYDPNTFDINDTVALESNNEPYWEQCLGAGKPYTSFHDYNYHETFIAPDIKAALEEWPNGILVRQRQEGPLVEHEIEPDIILARSNDEYGALINVAKNYYGNPNSYEGYGYNWDDEYQYDTRTPALGLVWSKWCSDEADLPYNERSWDTWFPTFWSNKYVPGNGYNPGAAHGCSEGHIGFEKEWILARSLFSGKVYKFRFLYWHGYQNGGGGNGLTYIYEDITDQVTLDSGPAPDLMSQRPMILEFAATHSVFAAQFIPWNNLSTDLSDFEAYIDWGDGSPIETYAPTFIDNAGNLNVGAVKHEFVGTGPWQAKFYFKNATFNPWDWAGGQGVTTGPDVIKCIQWGDGNIHNLFVWNDLTNVYNFANDTPRLHGNWGHSASEGTPLPGLWQTFDISNLKTLNRFMFWSGNNTTWTEAELALPDTSHITSMSRAFYAFNALSAQPLDITNIIDTSGCRDMSSFFNTLEDGVFTNIGSLNTSNVINFSGCFWQFGWPTLTVSNPVADPTNDYGNWDTSSARVMSEMFSYSRYTDTDLSGWDTSKVQNFERMFSGMQNYRLGGGPGWKWNIGNWDVSSGVTFSKMFLNTRFQTYEDELSVGGSEWNVTSNAVNFSRFIFDGGLSSQWNAGAGVGAYPGDSGTDPAGYYNGVNYGSDGLPPKVGPQINHWDMSNVLNISKAFTRMNRAIDQWDLSNLIVSYEATHPQNFGFSSTPSLDGDITDASVYADGFTSKYMDLSKLLFKPIFSNTTPTSGDSTNPSIFIQYHSHIGHHSGYLGSGWSTAALNYSSFDHNPNFLAKPYFYPLSNSATDPTNETWRTSLAPDTYEFVPNKGIYTFEKPITNFTGMFEGNTSFNDPDIKLWKKTALRYVTAADRMFKGCSSFNQDLRNWAFYVIESTPTEFATGSNLINYPEWNKIANTSVYQITASSDPTSLIWSKSVDASVNQDELYSATELNKPTISPGTFFLPNVGYIPNGGSITSFSNLFVNKIIDDSQLIIDMGTWDMSDVTDISSMFENVSLHPSISTEFTNHNYFNNWNLSSVKNISRIFYSSDMLPIIENWQFSSLNDMSLAFTGTTFNQDISSWNVSTVTNMSQLFYLAAAFNQDISSWDTSSVTNMYYLFREADAFNQDISSWDTSSVTDMNGMFNGALAFNQPIGSWDVTSVIDMGGMFYGADAFNQDLTSWDTIGLYQAPSLFVNDQTSPLLESNKPIWGQRNGYFLPLSNSETDPTSQTWRDNHAPAGYTFTPNVGIRADAQFTDFTSMFEGNSTFNDPDVATWYEYQPNTLGRHIIAADDMFKNATAFDQDLSSWSLHFIDSKPADFELNSGITPEKLPGFLSPNGKVLWRWRNISTYDRTNTIWRTYAPKYKIIPGIGYLFDSPPTSTYYMFRDVPSTSSELTNILDEDISTWDTSSVTNMRYMFYNADYFNKGGIASWDTSSVTNMQYMFANTGASGFNQPIGNWDVSSVTNMSYMFRSSVAFNQDLNSWDTSSVTNMSNMFIYTDSFNNGSAPGVSDRPLTWNTSSVTDMSWMFYDADAFNQDISSWDTSSVTTMYNLFSYSELFNQPIGNWNTSNVTNMRGTFLNAIAFNQDISSWDTSNVTNMYQMFYGAQVFNADISSWDVSNVTNMGEMFYGAAVFNQPIGNWDVSNVVNFRGMFRNAYAFNQPLGNWNVLKATSSYNGLAEMFYNASSFDQQLAGWNVSLISEPLNFSTNSPLSESNKPRWGEPPWPLEFSSKLYKLLYLSGPTEDPTSTLWRDYHAPADYEYFPGLGLSANEPFDDFTYMFSIDPSGTGTPAGGGGGTGTGGGGGAGSSNPAGQDAIVYDHINSDVAGWDISGVTSTKKMFYGQTSANGEAQALNGWDVSSVTDMTEMFAQSNINIPLDQWDVSSVTKMNKMFSGNAAFNQNISTWNTTGLTTPIGTAPTNFNSGGIIPDNYLPYWGLIGVTAAYPIVGIATDPTSATWQSANAGNYTYYTEPGREGIAWQAESNITNMDDMFAGTTFNTDISAWDISSVTSMNRMFKDNVTFNQDISGWNANLSVITLFATDFDLNTNPLWLEASKPTFIVYVPPNQGYYENLLNIPAQDSNAWTNYQVDISGYRYCNIRLVFEYTKVTSGFTGDIQIDNIQIGSTTYSFETDGEGFESNTSLNGAGVAYASAAFSPVTTGTSTGRWSRDASGTASSGTGRSDAADGSFYLYVETSGSGQNPGNRTYLRSPEFYNTESIFTFSLAQYGATTGSLDVNIDVGAAPLTFAERPYTYAMTSSTDPTSGDWTGKPDGYQYYPGEGIGAEAPITDMNRMFYQAATFNDDISSWDVSTVTDMQYMFGQATVFNQDLSSWDVSNVVNFQGMFSSAEAFNNGGQPLTWNISSATNITVMFYRAYAFNADITSWDVSNITSMDRLFEETAFNQPIGIWNVSNVTDMGGMFDGTTAFNQPIGNWDVSNVTRMDFMFSGATAFNQDISSWDVSNVTAMNNMFINASLFNQDLSSWNVLNASRGLDNTTPPLYFDDNTPAWVLPKPPWGQPQAFNTRAYTYALTSLTDPTSDRWTGQPAGYYYYPGEGIGADQPITDMSYMFYNTTFNEDISSWNVSTVTDMSYMFNTADAFNQDISSWDVSNVTDMQYMFSGALPANAAIGTLVQTIDNPNANNLRSGDNFGRSVAMSNTYTVTGAHRDNSDIGTAFIFNTATGQLLHTIGNPSTDTNTDDQFGYTVAVSDNYTLVAAPRANIGSAQIAGRVWAFNTVTGTMLWSKDNPTPSFNEQFGSWALAVNDTYAIVGAWDDRNDSVSGKVYVYNAATGSLVRTIVNPNAYSTINGDSFGRSVAINDTYLIASAFNEDDPTGTNSGKAYIFNIDTGALIHTLDNPNPDGNGTDDDFGWSVAMSDTYAAVGCWNEDEDGFINSGKVYIYDIVTGALLHTLNNPNPFSTVNDDRFGYSVAMTDTYTIVGAQYEGEPNDGTGSGKVYIYDTVTGELLDRLDNPNAYDTYQYDSFGFSVAISGTTVVVGTPYEDHSDGSTTSGIAYKYTISSPTSSGTTAFNQPIGTWNTGSVTNMAGIFQNASFNQPIGTWNVSNVTDMANMFQNAATFDQDISSWNTSNVTDMSNMFNGASTFNQDLSNWPVENASVALSDPTPPANFDLNATNWTLPNSRPIWGAPTPFIWRNHTYAMTSLTDPTSVEWTSAQKPAGYTYYPGEGIGADQPITNMDNMFKGVTTFNDDISSWDTTSVTTMSKMFYQAYAFNQPIGSWDVSNVTNMTNMFYQAYAFNQDISSWNVSSVTNMYQMFFFANVFNNGGVPLTWTAGTGTANVTDMGGMFRGAASFNQDISSWNVSNVTDMSYMFYSADAFNQNISSWDVSSVTDMEYMFYSADVFDQDISSWNVSNVTNMTQMFYNANVFNNGGVPLTWTAGTGTANVTNMYQMFRNANAFNQDISSWNTSNVTNMSWMFRGAASFNQDISSWDTSSVTTMYYMFYTATAFNQDISSWDVSNVTTMYGMFYGAYSFNNGYGNIPDPYTFSITATDNLNYIFADDAQGGTNVNDPTLTLTRGHTYVFSNSSGAHPFQIQTDTIGTAYNDGVTNNNTIGDVTFTVPLGAPNTLYYQCTLHPDMLGTINIIDEPARPLTWNVSNVTDMSEMFRIAYAFNQPIGTWNTGSVTNMSQMFYDANAFNQDISSWNMSNVGDMYRMFYGADAFNNGGAPLTWTFLTNLNDQLSLSGMFYGATAFNADISSWNVSRVTNMSEMFRGAPAFNQNISSWDVSSVTDMEYMFYSADVFDQDISSWNVSNVTNMKYMFSNSDAFNANISSWDVSGVINMHYMFNNAIVFNQPIGNWDVSNVKDMAGMFSGTLAFNQNISSWDVSSVTDMTNMFNGASLFNQDLSGWNVSLIPSTPSTFDSNATSWVLPNSRPVWGTVGTVPLTHAPGTDPHWDNVISLIKVYNNNVHDLAPNGNSFVNHADPAPTVEADTFFGDATFAPLGALWKRIENIPGAITAEAWVKITAYSPSRDMFNTRVYEFPGISAPFSYAGWDVSTWASSGGVLFESNGSGSIFSNVLFPVNQWFNIAVQFDGRSLSVWIDGTFVGTRLSSNTIKFYGGIGMFGNYMTPINQYTGPTGASEEFQAGDLVHSVRITKGHRYVAGIDFTPVEFIEGPGLNTTPPVNPYI